MRRILLLAALTSPSILLASCATRSQEDYVSFVQGIGSNRIAMNSGQLLTKQNLAGSGLQFATSESSEVDSRFVDAESFREVAIKPTATEARPSAQQPAVSLGHSIRLMAAQEEAFELNGPSGSNSQADHFKVPVFFESHPVVTTAVSPAPSQLQAPATLGSAYSLESFEQLAMQGHPTLFQADANIAASQGAYVQSGLYPNPQVGYAQNEAGNDGAAGQIGFFIAQQFVRGNKLDLQQHAEFHRYLAAISESEIQQLRLLTSVRTRFYELLAAQRSQELLNDLVNVNRQGLQQLEALVRAGQTTRVAVLQAQIELQQAELGLKKAQNNYQAAWQRMAAIVNQPQLPIAQVEGSLEESTAPLEPNDLLERILSQSPEIVQANERIQQARAALQRQVAEPIPDLNVQTGLAFDDSTDDVIGNLQVGVRLPLWNKNQGNIQRARAELTSACQELQRVQLDIRSRFAETMQEYSNALAEVEQYRDFIIPEAAETLALLKETYETEGEIEFLQLILAQRTNFDTQIAFLEAQQQLRIAEAKLAGQLLTGGLQAPAAY